MRITLLIICVVWCLKVWGQDNSLSPFLKIPTIVNQIKESSNKSEVLDIYQQFEKAYPSESFSQVHFLTDQVHIAAVHKLKSLGLIDLVPYVIKIYNPKDRINLMENVVSESWQYKSVDSLISRYSLSLTPKDSYGRNTILLYTELLCFTGRLNELYHFLKINDYTEKIEEWNPYFMISYYQKMNMHQQAIPVLGNIIKNGKADTDSTQQLLALWKTSYGNNKGFTEYYESLLGNIREKKKLAIANHVLSYPAPNFEVVDLLGNTVTLDKLKGKVVFLDFWATWCGPCLASFPAMQRVVDKYANNENVLFYFVNTMERFKDEELRVEKIKEVLKKGGYDFNVLLDSKLNGAYDLLSKFKVGAIPQQFVIDKNGVIRYHLKGFDGSIDGLIQEVDVVIQETLKY